MTTSSVFNLITEKIRDELMTAVQIPVEVDVMLNACSTGAVYLCALIAGCENSIGTRFSTNEFSVSLETRLDELKSLVRGLESIRSSHLDSAGSALKLRMVGLAGTLREVSFEHAVTSQTETKFQDDFKRAFGDVFGQLQLKLNEENYSGLLQRLSGGFAESAEKIIKDKKFVPAGAALFRRIVKWLMVLFQDDHQFKRLQDIAIVLTLPNPDELRSSYGNQWTNPNRLSLSGQDLKEIVKLRIDWETHDLAFLMN
jgi:hypothetical protein